VKLFEDYIEKQMLDPPLFTLFQPPEMLTDGAKNAGCYRSMSLRIGIGFGRLFNQMLKVGEIHIL
jgi:hypothetical protein